MNFLTEDIRKLYSKFLAASLGSALVMSIYSFVDTIAVGQSEGPAGSSAMAVITPLYGIIVFLAILCGIGGSVLMSNARGKGNEEKGNAYFTASILLMGWLTVIVWIAFGLFHKEIFTFFGADAEIMPKVMEYAEWIIWFFPVFIAPTFISSFIRNDGAPGLAMAAVMIGGCVNIFGDWFLVFPLGMGMKGAAIATVIGTSLQVLIMCSHFRSERCHLKFVKPYNMCHSIWNILEIGFGASALELGTVTIAIMMNNQVMRYGGNTELAVYGVIAAVGSLFQALFGGVGQAIQPLVSANYGAGKTERTQSFWKMSFVTVLVLGGLFTCIGEFFPVQLVRLFVNATPEVVEKTPTIVRLFYIIYLFLGTTVLSTYYLQSTMHDKMSMLVAVLRGIVIDGLLIFFLPIFFDINGVWLALPCSELIVAVIALLFIKRKTFVENF